MPKGHPISVPRTWPGHRDWEPSRPAIIEVLEDAIRKSKRELRPVRPSPMATETGGRLPACPVPDGSCLLCDDDHCREL